MTRQRRNLKLLVLISATMLVAPAFAADSSPTQPASKPASQFGSVEELKHRIAQAKKEWYDPYRADKYVLPNHEAYVFLADALASPSKEVRDFAISTLLTIDYPIRSGAFLKYLSDKYPIDVQMVAVIKAAAPNGGDPTEFWKSWGIWLKKANALLGAEVCPPYFGQAFVAVETAISEPGVEKAKMENQTLVFRRVVACLSKAATSQERELLLRGISFGLDSRVLPDVILEVYPIEPAANIRRILLRYIDGEWTDPKLLATVKRIVALAQKDPDAECAAMAAKLAKRYK